MALLDLIKQRYSCRAYQPQPVEKEKLAQVINAARHAPSAVNNQPWHFVVIQDRKNLDELCTVYRAPWLKTAPAIIVACGDHSVSWRRPDGKDHCDIDMAIAIDHLTLQAAELGLATCWVCMFNAFDTSRLLKLPKGVEPIALLPIGYPEDTPTSRHTECKPLTEILHWETF